MAAAEPEPQARRTTAAKIRRLVAARIVTRTPATSNRVRPPSTMTIGGARADDEAGVEERDPGGRGPSAAAESCVSARSRYHGGMPHKLLLADDSVTIQRVIELTFADEDVHGHRRGKRTGRDRSRATRSSRHRPRRRRDAGTERLRGRRVRQGQSRDGAHSGRAADRRVRAGRRRARALGRLRRRAGQAVRAADRDQPRQGSARRAPAVRACGAPAPSAQGPVRQAPAGLRLRPPVATPAPAIRSRRTSIISTRRSRRPARRPAPIRSLAMAPAPPPPRADSASRRSRVAGARPAPKASRERSVRGLGSGSDGRPVASRAALDAPLAVPAAPAAPPRAAPQSPPRRCAADPGSRLRRAPHRRRPRAGCAGAAVCAAAPRARCRRRWSTRLPRCSPPSRRSA